MVTSRCSLLVLLGCAAATPRTEVPDDAPPPIEWRSFGGEAFEEAAREGKLLLVDVGIEGCTACRWMAEDTYTDPRVLRRVHAHFVPVAVDADARPDLGERWSRWGWPATIVLSPEGEQLFAVRGSKRPRNFVPILDRVIAARAEGTLTADTEADLVGDPAAEGALERACEETRDALGPPRGLFVRGAPMQLALLRAETRGEDLAPALRTAESWQRLLDPVWGGVFVGALQRGGRLVPITEKRLLHNAAALEAFALAHARTGDPSARQAAAEVHRYVRDWLTDPSGGFYATQEDDAPGLPEEMRAADYYALEDDAARRRYGIPPIDHAIYADLNGRMIAAYALAAIALADDELLAAARRAGDVLAARQTDAGWVRQVASSEAVAQDERMRALDVRDVPYLRAQAWALVAFTRLYDATAEARWMTRAREVADATVAALRTEQGAFRSAPSSGAPLAPRYSLSDHAVLARGLARLGALSGEPRYAEIAAGALRVVARPGRLARRGPEVLGEVGLALEHLLLGPVEISLVADPNDPAAHALRAAAERIVSTRRVVKFEPDGRYPRQETPVAYVCTSVACSSPVADPARLAEVVAQLSRREGAACGPR